MATACAALVASCARGRVADRPDAAAQDDAPSRSVDAHALLPDAAPDAPGCTISAGTTIALDGSNDLAKYPASAHVAPGAAMTSGADDAAITWDRTHLYVTVTSDAFTSAYEPLHVYLETAPQEIAAPSSGKEYSGLVPALPFTASYLVAARRVTDAGTGPYDGVYVPAMAWDTRQTALAPGSDVFVSSDLRTLSVQVAWSALGGCPPAMRLAVHVVHAVQLNEWKDLVPSTHTPWQAPGGGYYDIDLAMDPATTNWVLR